ncbi:MAG: aspartyl protease family protein [Chthoniobacterales bacterium]
MKIFGFVAIVAVAICAALAAGAPQLAGHVAVPVRYVPLNKMIVTVQINSHPANLLVDTGANHIEVAADSATLFGITPSQHGLRYIGYERINGRSCPIAFLRNLSAGGMNFGSAPVTLLPGDARRSFGTHGAVQADGILGADILVRHNAVINCRTKFIFFKTDRFAGTGIAPVASSAEFRRIPLRREQNGRFTVPFSLGGQTGRLFVDTGAFVTTFNEALLKSAGIALQPAHVSGRFGDGISRQYDMGQVNNLAIGDFKVRPAKFGAAALPSYMKNQAAMQIGGILGMDLLYDYNAIIDFGSMSLFLK